MKTKAALREVLQQVLQSSYEVSPRSGLLRLLRDVRRMPK